MTVLILCIVAGLIAVGVVLVVWCCLRIGARTGQSWDELAESASEVNAQERDAAKRRHPSARGRRRDPLR